MFSEWKRRRAARRVEPGDGRALTPYRWWQPLTRALMHLDLDTAGEPERWSVDLRFWGDSDTAVRAHLFRDGRHTARSKLPAEFPVPGGVIEVNASDFGLRRCHYVTGSGDERPLSPEPRSAEGWRAHLQRRHPVASRVLGAVSVAVLLVSLVLGVPQLVQQVTEIPPVAERLGTFESPVHLPGWTNAALVVAGILASVERALRLRYHWLLDGGVSGTED
ncbi:hypothetical protein [Cellulomonas taurus]|uniref:hypothetical protein n=1 Tax=Cellulomonas taurus TaxID=2729175 RepID=UPI00145FB7BF|nr:hypothetical protein [Cellulomonas taurus]